MTTDQEREIVLLQNEALRAHGDTVFQRLRRCCICLGSQCEDKSACREAFSVWAEQKWDRAVRAACVSRGKSLDESIVFTY